jgi:ribonuclease HI
MKKIEIYTDGSSRGNPGPGGWGIVIIEDNKIRELGGREDHTTNNRMELMASIQALKNTSKESDTIMNVDSEYVINGITKWIHGWIKKGWRTADKKQVLNQDLWKELYSETKDRNIVWKSVRSHTGDKYNERADVIATGYADKVF